MLRHRSRVWPAFALAVLVAVAGCQPAAPLTPVRSATASGLTGPDGTPATATASPTSVERVLLGSIVTMAEPAIAEAVAFEGGRVLAVGSREDVMELADAETRVIELGDNVAYPGFIDAHAHWIGDRDYYGLETAADAMDAALSRGWTSISEQWVNRERLDELERLAADDELPIRVDAYLALNEPQVGGQHFGAWYADREPGPITDWLRVQGVKLHTDWGVDILWEADELNATIAAANAAGWQIAAHAIPTEANEMVLDAFEAAIGPTGPNPLHHRIEHVLQVTDPQLARMVAMQLPVVIHLDTVAADWVGDPEDVAALGGDTAWLTRWRDFVDAGLHAAGASDAPWIFPNFTLMAEIGRPVDQIAGGMDPRGWVHPEPPEWMAAQLLTAEQGLRAVTVDAAYALRDEANRGHLAPGTFADITILSRDVAVATPDQIRSTMVIATIVGGQAAYCADAAYCP
jgi:predicted amidohydrolase YtcJ